MAEFLLKGVCRYTSRLFMKPLREFQDHWHTSSDEELEAARDANFLAYMLNLAYDYYEKPERQYFCIEEWDRCGYEKISRREFKDYEALELLNNKRFIAIALRRKREHKGDEFPDVLVLLRGTSSVEDIREDLHILNEHLHGIERVKLTEALVLELVEKYGVENVCLVGHSLGAAVAFLIARKFYLEHKQQTVEGHYFNLPFMCYETVLKEILDLFSIEYAWFRVAVNGLGLNSAFNKFTDMVAGGSRHLLFLKEVADKAEVEFDELRGWKPNIYVNPNDRFSKSYIDFFEDLKQHGIGKSGMSKFTGFLARLGFDAKAHHLCPSANLIITNKGISTVQSHKLDTWVNVKPRHLRIKSYDWNGDVRLQAKRNLGVQQTRMAINNALRSHELRRARRRWGGQVLDEN